MAKNFQVNTPAQAITTPYDPYGVAPSSANPNNLKRAMAQRLMQKSRFKPTNGQYPTSQGLADLANTGLGLYMSHKANQDDISRENKMAEALIGQMRGGNIDPQAMPQRQANVMPVDPSLGDNTEMEPGGPSRPVMEEMPAPRMSAGYQMDPSYNAMIAPGAKGNYNLPMVQAAHKMATADRADYRTNSRLDRTRAEDQIIAERQNQRTMAQQDRQFQLSEQRLQATSNRAERAYSLQNKKFDMSLKKMDRLINNDRIKMANSEKANSLSEEKFKFDKVKENRTRLKDVNTFVEANQDDWMKEQKDFKYIQGKYQNFLPAIKQNNIIGDRKAIVEFIKMSDSSQVTINENNMVEKARGVGDWLGNIATLVMGDQSLTPMQRERLYGLATEFHKEGVKDHRHSQGLALKAHKMNQLPGQIGESGGDPRFNMSDDKILTSIIPDLSREFDPHSNFASKTDQNVIEFMKSNDMTDFRAAQRAMGVSTNKKTPSPSNNASVPPDRPKPVSVSPGRPKPVEEGLFAKGPNGEFQVSVGINGGKFKWIDVNKLKKTNPKLYQRFVDGG